MEYGSVRKYKKFLRERKDFRNPSEQKFKELMVENEMHFVRAGYPDFMLLDDLGEIIGFVEVKPNKKSKLRPGQERFKRMCIRYGIPFCLWVEGDSLPFTR